MWVKAYLSTFSAPLFHRVWGLGLQNNDSFWVSIILVTCHVGIVTAYPGSTSMHPAAFCWEFHSGPSGIAGVEGKSLP